MATTITMIRSVSEMVASTTLKPGQRYHTTTIYKFSTEAAR